MLADKIAIIYRGRILTSGTIGELKRTLLGPAEYEVRVRGDWPKDPVALPDGMTSMVTGQTGPRFRVENPEKAPGTDLGAAPL